MGPGSPTNLTIANGGTYEHAQDGGTIVTAIWSTGSTCKVSGTVAVTSIPGGGSQNFHNLTWDCPTQTANTSIGAYGAVIGGNVTLVTSNTGRFYFMASNSGKVTINGNFTVQAGNFGVNGTGSLTNDTVICNGNVVVTGGNFAVSRGSQGGTGTTVWYQYGDVSLSNCTSQNSNPSGAKMLFSKQGTQTLTLSNITYGTGAGSPVNYEVASGSILNLGTSDFGTAPNASTGSFRVLTGATVFTAHASGLNGNVTCTGAQGGGNLLATDASYGFNGSVAQVTGSLMPATVNNLVINNPAGVALSQPTTINGVLRLVAGVFNNTIPFTLGPGGSISYEGGSLLVSVKSDVSTIPETFFVDQNYPNPFNPSTTVRFGLPGKSFVTAKVFNLLGQEVATLFEGRLEPGIHTADFDAAGLASGLYLCRIQAGSIVDIKRMILMK
jgi:hypothetical protein